MATISGTLRVTPETMLTVSGQFGDCNEKWRTLMQTILEIATILSNTWQSPASKVFYDRLKALQPEMEKIYRMIKEHTDDLQQMAKLYQAAEKSAQTQASSLKTAGIA